ncbi:hypothetical protein [Geothrix alkalitolerans]|uniref:hypothetical protein n=1 Tax=Geothrix alkalitolerans TaxID=2922724 RepID=UPI001FAF4963|nr:hypothetical protein [Geothrix alkalitolerans]
MLIAALLAGLLQVGAGPDSPAVPAWEPAHAGLMAKAPGTPGYGVQFTTPSGRLVFTNLHFDPATRDAKMELYRIQGPAGMGPYRLGAELGFHAKEPTQGSNHPCWFDNFFYAVRTLEGSPARSAGLDPGKYGGRFAVTALEGVDGKNFGWDLGALVWYLTNRPEVELNLIRRPVMFGGPSRRNPRVTLRKVETAIDPADGFFTAGGIDSALIQPWLGHAPLWRDLLILRSRTPRLAPLAVDLPTGRRWLVSAPTDPSAEGPGKGQRTLEVWREDPLAGPYPYAKALADLWLEPREGLGPGRVLRIEGQWYRIQTLTTDPATGRPTACSLGPWKADIPALLAGASEARELGSLPSPGLWETLEQAANDALLEWKTLALPDALASQDAQAAAALVLRIEKGLLALDLEVKGIRSRLDAAARAEAERKAQAELATKEGKPARATPAPPVESERLADLLDQRKAILMAILGNAKQSLASLRR